MAGPSPRSREQDHADSPSREARPPQRSQAPRPPRERTPVVERVPQRRKEPQAPDRVVEVHNEPHISRDTEQGRRKGDRQVRFANTLDYEEDVRKGHQYPRTPMQPRQEHSLPGRYRNVTRSTSPEGEFLTGRPYIVTRTPRYERSRDVAPRPSISLETNRPRPRIIQDGNRHVEEAGQRILAEARRRQARERFTRDLKSYTAWRPWNRRSERLRGSEISDGIVSDDKGTRRYGPNLFADRFSRSINHLQLATMSSQHAGHEVVESASSEFVIPENNQAVDINQLSAAAALEILCTSVEMLSMAATDCSDDWPMGAGPHSTWKTWVDGASLTPASNSATELHCSPTRDEQEGHHDFFQQSILSNRFLSKREPPISLRDYLLRLHRYCPMSTAVYLATSMYITRMASVERVILVSPKNMHRLVLAGLGVAMKTLEDLSYPHSRVAKVGGVTERELSKLEISFCFLADFDLRVDAHMLFSQAAILDQNKDICHDSEG
ncbi:putative cyclin-dependent protein kinase complex component [Aspergillus affinis]|uniref:putative cyclin-dependent protein kinase complex component n=1 Tax=Aspergillus affinis TaxID=1070780 RepID=UPI0022FEA544|nr:cyclin-domain-containing protein [Aspergillus affinis]KAI9036589.1 cyclin-domain-containing protein [Aspergillus affinis]